MASTLVSMSMSPLLYRSHLRSFSAILVIAALAVSSCASDTQRFLDGTAAEIYSGECVQKTGDTVTIYSGRTENLIEPVLDAFACETGIPVMVRWGASTDLALLLNEEGSKSPADVFLSRSPGPVGYLESKKLLRPLSSDVLELVEEQNRSDSGTWIGFSGRKRVLVHNIDDVPIEDLPNSVFDLTDKRYEGRVAIPATNGSFVDWFTVFRDVHGNEAAQNWLEQMVDNDARYYYNNRAIVEAAGRGEIDMGLVNHYYNYQEIAASGNKHRAKNHDLGDQDIGSLLIITAATVLSSTDKAAESESLVSYLLSTPVQKYFTNRTFEYPLAFGVDPAEALPPLTALEIGSVDFDKLGGGFEETTRMIEATGILNQ
ncbi:MAG: iron(III) transport system substrate-binding protein [Candidatus Poriferisodalaceae bacterium]|jgi:iron(III) transport system substrate-binding protein